MTGTRTEPEAVARENSRGTPQGDALATWAVWMLLLGAMAATYTRLDISDLYNVSRDGIDGAVSRILVQVNYPISLVAIAAVLIALDTLESRRWWLGGPVIAACAVTAWPGVVDDGDLDARLINIVPAVGVAGALTLTIIATRGSGAALQPRCRFDTGRVIIAAVVLFLSLPWIAADLGFYLPDVGFITERPITGSDGVVNPAVHLGHHHGFDGSLILLSALFLSRPKLHSPTLRTATTGYVALMAAYGAINATQDFWHEQIQKRGWTDWTFPKATEPTLTAIWLLILAAAVAIFVLLSKEHATDAQPIGP